MSQGPYVMSDVKKKIRAISEPGGLCADINVMEMEECWGGGEFCERIVPCEIVES